MSGYIERLKRVKTRLKENLNIEDEVIGIYVDLDDLNEEKEDSKKKIDEGIENGNEEVIEGSSE